MNDLIIKQGKLINGQIVDILVRDSKLTMLVYKKLSLIIQSLLSE